MQPRHDKVNLDPVDRHIINCLQRGVGIESRPFAALADELNMEEALLLVRIRRLLDNGTLTRFGPKYDVECFGGRFCLCAMTIPDERFEIVSEQVNAFPEVAHNYQREHHFNMWFVLAVEKEEQLNTTIERIESVTGLPILTLPKEHEFCVHLELPV